jgi:hypothetical protein
MWASRAPRERLSAEVGKGIMRTEGSRGRVSSGNDVRYREQGRSTEAACVVQKRNWIRAGNEGQGPMRN